MRHRAWLEVPALLGLAALCALVSNVLAGPARRLSWFPREVTATNTTSTTITPTITSSPMAPSTSTAPAPPPMARPAPTAAKPAPDQGPKQDLLSRFPPLPGQPQSDLSGEEAVWLHGHGALFVDARRSSVFAQGHIPGARSLPAWEDGLVEKVEQLGLFTADLKAPVVVYCSGGDCQDSHLVAQKLWLAGFRNLRIYVDGFPDWEHRALPVARGEAP